MHKDLFISTKYMKVHKNIVYYYLAKLITCTYMVPKENMEIFVSENLKCNLFVAWKVPVA